MAGLVAKFPGVTATRHAGTIKRMLRESLFEHFFAGYALGSDYPSRMPSDASGGREIGDFAFKGHNLSPGGGAVASDVYAALGSDKFYELPFSMDELQNVAGLAGITVASVVDFQGALSGTKFAGGNYGSTLGGLVLGQIDQYQSLVIYPGGGSAACFLPYTDYTDAGGPEFLAVTATDASMVLYNRQPGAALRSNTQSLSEGPSGVSRLQVGMDVPAPYPTWNAPIRVYSHLVFVKALSLMEIGQLYTDLQTFHGTYGVTI